MRSASGKILLLKTGLFCIVVSSAAETVTYLFFRSALHEQIPLVSTTPSMLFWGMFLAGFAGAVVATRKVISHVLFLLVELFHGRGRAVLANLITGDRGMSLLKRILRRKIGNDQMLLAILDGTPGKTAVISDGREIGYRELKERTIRIANGLLSLGLAPGGNYAVMLRNSVEVLEAGVFAATVTRTRAVLVNFHLKSDEIAYILENSNATIFITSPEFLQEVEKADEKMKQLQHIIVVKDPLYRNVPIPNVKEHAEKYVDYDVLIAQSSSREPDLNAPVMNDAGAMLYTGGTTGRSKGTNTFGVLTSSLLPQLDGHSAHIRDVIRMFDNFSQGLDLHKPKPNVYLAAGPIYHAAPLAFSVVTLLLKGTIVTMRRFDPAEAIALIEKHRVSTTFMAPILIKRILNVPDKGKRDMKSLKVLICAAAPASPELKKAAVDFFGPVFYEFYGSSDVGINTILKPEHYLEDPARYASVGKAAPGNRIKIVDSKKEECPPLVPGDLLINNFACSTLNYYNDPEKTKQAFVTIRGESYFMEGEVAYYDKDGFYYISDRKKDMIISGGVNIYPAEIEAILGMHPDVMDVAVIGIPDQEWGESPHAIVELKQAVRPDGMAEQLSSYCSEHIAGFKRPKSFEFVPHLPRDSDGKIKKRILRERYWTGKAVKV